MKTIPPSFTIILSRPIRSLLMGAMASMAMAGSASALDIDFNSMTTGGNPTGAKYRSAPAGTEIVVVGAGAGSPFAAGNGNSVVLTDTTASATPILSYQGTDSYLSGVASLDFYLYGGVTDHGTFTDTSLTLRVGGVASGQNGNLGATEIAAQVRLSANGVIAVSDTSGSLFNLDQTVSLNTVYHLEVLFDSKASNETGTFQLKLTTGGTTTLLTSNSGATTVFSYRGSTTPNGIDTIWVQSGINTAVASSVAVDNFLVIPEPTACVMVAGAGVLMASWRLRKRVSA